MKKVWIAIAFIISAGFALSLFYYPRLPAMIPSHWNAAGEIDAFLPKEIALSLLPFISIFLALLLFTLPKIDPLKKNYSYFMPYLEGFLLLLVLFLLYIHCLTILAGFGVRLEMNYLMLPAMSAIFLYSALLLKKAKRNWFVGIRTPWTLSSEMVWNKTHKFASYCFALLGVIFAVLVFVPSKTAFYLMLFFVLFIAFMPVVYSYFLWRQEQEKSHA